MKRIALFLATNLAIMLVLGIVLSVLGVDSRSTSGLLIMALLFGMGGSIISLLMSKKIALASTRAQVISQPRNEAEAWLLSTVQKQAQTAGIGMPDVAIYDSPEVNAFATGAKRNEALVAVSSGLLQTMGRDQVEAVLAHEVSHVANGDMVTLTLIQGVVNTFVIFLARIIAGIIDSFVSNNDEDGEGLGFFAYMAVVLVLEMCLGIVASIIVAWFSRQREFKADAGGAVLAGRGKMISALQALKNGHPSELKGELAAFGINGGKSMADMMMSHPPLDTRIAALQRG